MISAEQLDALEPQMRQAMLSLVSELQAQLQAKDELIARHDREAAFKQALIEKLTHENAMLKRLKFAATSERFASTLALTRAQVDALVLGLPWQRVGEAGIIRVI